VYLGYVIGGGEIEIDATHMKSVMECLVPTIVTEVRIFLGEM
jgi:hypothetical protein